MKKSCFPVLLAGGIFLGISLGLVVFAYRIQDLTEVPVRDDFVLGPGKTELWMDPGEKLTRELYITNRLGKTMDFKIEIEDFTGSYDPEKTVVLLGEEKGPYSLKDYLKPEITEFTLSHGQRMILPAEISIPQDAEPGGRYGAILVATSPPEPLAEEEPGKAKGVMRMIARLGTLFFVRVRGEVEEKGFLNDFRLAGPAKKFYEQGPITFKLLYQNDGSIHLVPYGIIEISNILGKKVGEVEVDPYFAMPGSLRARDVKWEKKFLFGKYTALASLNRGYDDIIDQKSLTFWVIPWKIVLAGLAIIVLIVLFFRWLIGTFEIRRKR